MYPGLFNSTYVPSPAERIYIGDPVDSLGPWFCAALFLSLLTGVILVQIYKYTEEEHEDPVLLQALVYLIFLLCIGNSAGMLSFAWRFFVKDFGDFSRAPMVSSSVDKMLSMAPGYLIGLLVQSFFIYRGFTLSKNWYFLVAVLLSSLVQLAGEISLCIIVYHSKSEERVLLSGLPFANMMSIGTLATDTLIAAFTYWCLHKRRRTATFSSTGRLISRLITLVMQSATPPLICAVLNLGWNFSTYGMWVFFFNSALPYLYMISMMFTLNSRSGLRKSRQIQEPNIYRT